MHTSLLSLLLLAFVASSAAGPLVKRNPCDGIDAMPELYKEYGTQECPPKYRDHNLHCPFGREEKMLFDGKSDCVKYCEIRTNFFYGQEQPFANTYCHGPLSCTISETKTRTVSVGAGLNLAPKIFDALSIGVSGSVSFASATAFARSYTMKLEKGECGYFTFVPVIHESCGTLTEARPRVEWRAGVFLYFCGSEESYYSTTSNYCTSQLRRNPDGSVDGETIFVRTDCATRKPLPPDQQDAVYQRPNVPLPRALMEHYAIAFEQQSTGETKGTIECAGGSGSGPLEACRGLANQQGSIEGPWTIPAGSKGDHHWFGDYPSRTHNPDCSYYIDFLEDLDPEKCPLKLQGIAGLIEDITDTCSGQGVYGSVTLGGDCPMRLTTGKRSWPEGENPP